MLIVTVKIQVKPKFKQVCLDNFKSLSKDVETENGFIAYKMYTDPDNENNFFLFEKWESQELLDAHLATKHMQEYFKISADWFVDKQFEIFVVK